MNDLNLLIANSRAASTEMLRDFAPDVVFVCGWYWLIEKSALDRVPLGVFGIHNSLLPKYRGGAPLVWSIINGDPVLGASVFRFATGIDDGDILLQVRVMNEPYDNVATILEKIETALLMELPSSWKNLLKESATLSKQDEASATYCGQRLPEDRLIDWRNDARKIHDFIRAQSPPYPGAFSYLGGNKVTVLRTELDRRVFYGTPGQVLLRQEPNLLVACGSCTALLICELSVDDVVYVPSQLVRSISGRFDSHVRMS